MRTRQTAVLLLVLLTLLFVRCTPEPSEITIDTASFTATTTSSSLAPIPSGDEKSFRVSFPANGGAVSFTVSSTGAWTTDMLTEPWLSLSKTSGEEGQSVIGVVLSPNTTAVSRSCAVTFRCGDAAATVTLSQERLRKLVTSGESVFLESEEGSFSVSVETFVESTATILPDCSWLAVSSAAGGKFCFTFERNETYDDREGHIVFSNEGLRISDTIFVAQTRKDGLFIDSGVRFVGAAGGTFSVRVGSNNDVKVEIPGSGSWVSRVGAKGISYEDIQFAVSASTEDFSRETEITFVSRSLRQTIKVRQRGVVEERERDALIRLYELTGGPSWMRSENWCSDKPVGEWEGITTVQPGNVVYILLSQNGLEGRFPDDIWGFEKLTVLYMPGNDVVFRIPEDPDSLTSSLWEISIGNYVNMPGTNRLEGGLPHSLSKLTALKRLSADDMGITGTIPDEIWSLPQLQELSLSANHIEGPLTSAIGNAKKLELLYLSNNHLEGEIPNEFCNMESLQQALLGNSTRHNGKLVTNNNHFTRLPEGLERMRNLWYLSVSATGLEGFLPEGLFNNTSITHLCLNSCATYEGYKNRLVHLNKEFGQMKSLRDLWLYDAGLSGEIPMELAGAENLIQLLLDSNDITGNIPDSFSEMQYLETLDVRFNRLSGELSAGVIENMNRSGRQWRLYPQQYGYGLTYPGVVSSIELDGMITTKGQVQRTNNGERDLHIETPHSVVTIDRSGVMNIVTLAPESR